MQATGCDIDRPEQGHLDLSTLRLEHLVAREEGEEEGEDEVEGGDDHGQDQPLQRGRLLQEEQESNSLQAQEEIMNVSEADMCTYISQAIESSIVDGSGASSEDNECEDIGDNTDEEHFDIFLCSAL